MNSAVFIISAFSCVYAISAMDHGNCSPEWQKYVWCESQCIDKTTSGGEQTEDYRLDSLQIETDYLLTSADLYSHLAFAIYKYYINILLINISNLCIPNTYFISIADVIFVCALLISWLVLHKLDPVRKSHSTPQRWALMHLFVNLFLVWLTFDSLSQIMTT